MLFLFLFVFIIHLSYSININGKNNLFINTSCDNNNKKKKKWNSQNIKREVMQIFNVIQSRNVMNMRDEKQPHNSNNKINVNPPHYSNNKINVNPPHNSNNKINVNPSHNSNNKINVNPPHNSKNKINVNPSHNSNMRNMKKSQYFYESINKKEGEIYPTKYNFQRNNNVIYKQIPEFTYPYKKYNIDDIYYGRILSINSKKIKLDILCDRKAYLNTSEYFNNHMMNKYIYNILNINNIIKVQIKNIEKIHQKIHVDIKKYTYEEFLSSFKNNNIYINSKVIHIKPKYALLYLAPKIIGKLMYDKNEDMQNLNVGNDVHVKIDYFDKMKNELYLIR
ncbi:conserved Plasmodium protein, unknown function [Plasmodium sp. gorilla clade G2]|uniref:conserved Plasmodium protein, unknown function n=1 Tax=Plasmodium sp. gorilla clade G2 TaxID=880535 RepID=UPI000D2185DD|nr:conserved Plasmodium protein, unknown function [Plasmodium sp. gorilla clade G2]SOV10233.1 conserved Plasmodium protein, unknown function [Plasmodium sp. gorilla clade G2]